MTPITDEIYVTVALKKVELLLYGQLDPYFSQVRTLKRRAVDKTIYWPQCILFTLLEAI